MANSNRKRVVVVGSINMDVVAEVTNLPHRGETVLARNCSHLPGGKGANQAIAAQNGGAEAMLIGSVGNDSPGEELITFLQKHNVDITEVDRFGGPSGFALILVENSGENSIVISTGANQYVTPATVRRLDWSPSDVVLLQNEIPHATNVETVTLAHTAGAIVVYNPAPWRDESAQLATSVDVLILNHIEFGQFLATSHPALKASYESGEKSIATILQELETPANLIVTLGDKGAIARVNDKVVQINAIPAEVKDSTGAGDAFCGNFAAALSHGETIEDAIRYANVAAGICVERRGAGTSMPTRAEVKARLVS